MESCVSLAVGRGGVYVFQTPCADSSGEHPLLERTARPPTVLASATSGGGAANRWGVALMRLLRCCAANLRWLLHCYPPELRCCPSCEGSSQPIFPGYPLPPPKPEDPVALHGPRCAQSVKTAHAHELEAHNPRQLAAMATSDGSQ